VEAVTTDEVTALVSLVALTVAMVTLLLFVVERWRR
jgi:hypothetical protein